MDEAAPQEHISAVYETWEKLEDVYRAREHQARL
jgi:hypothetical protein